MDLIITLVWAFIHPIGTRTGIPIPKSREGVLMRVNKRGTGASRNSAPQNIQIPQLHFASTLQHSNNCLLLLGNRQQVAADGSVRVGPHKVAGDTALVFVHPYCGCTVRRSVYTRKRWVITEELPPPPKPVRIQEQYIKRAINISMPR